ncbi:MAG TPA: hypothetical protein PKY12_14955 [Catalimonadaceae bacterium]|nr:hypothetical protein [Catalimonadaceae bacterium]
MKLSESEGSLLFKGKTLLANPPSQALAVFPETTIPRQEELQFLRSMFSAMRWPVWEIRYFITSSKTIPDQFAGIPYILYFGFEGSENLEVSVVEAGDSVHFNFPKINLFQSNHSIKTLVWKALKPYSQPSNS